MKTIAIIGFGFCGRLALYNLAKRSNLKIIIFDKQGFDNRGAAFSSFSSYYILNVPADKMSAFSDVPYDFCNFLEKKYPQIWQKIGEKGFAPRQVYGEYLHEITGAAIERAKQNNVEVEFVAQEVVEVGLIKNLVGREDSRVIEESFDLKTENGKSCQSNEILLATSFTQSELPFNFAAKNFIKKLWNHEALQFHQQKFSDEKICLIGSGLTAVDVIVGLKKKNFNGKIYVISRRGNFPQKHFKHNPVQSPFIFADDAKNGLLFLCLKIRKFLAANPQCDLRHVIDSMRHITQELWHNLDSRNKKLFLKILPYWNIFRHRAPDFSIEVIDKMLAENQLEIKKCGVKNIIQNGDKFEVETKDTKIICDYLVNCLGFEFRPEKYSLLNQMIASKLLQKDLFLANSNNSKIHLLGGLNIARDFECTAVPDLRVNVESVCQNLY